MKDRASFIATVRSELDKLKQGYDQSYFAR